MNIDKVKTFVSKLANKNQKGFLNGDDFNVYAERAHMEEFMDRYGNPKEYQPGQPIPRIAYEVTQKITDDMRVFKKLITLPIDKFGKSAYPVDYVHLSSVRYRLIKASGDEKEVEVDVIPDDKLGGRLSSDIVNPSKKYPICTLYDTYMQFYPKNLAGVKFTYLRQPTVPKWAFTFVDGREIYDPDNSVDFDFPDTVHNSISIKILSYLGINLREAEIVQYAEAKDQSGI